MAVFDALRAPVVGGDGVVGRWAGIVVLAHGPDAAVQRLLQICAEVAGPRPGRPLARRLAAWLAGDDAPADELRFGTVSPPSRAWPSSWPGRSARWSRAGRRSPGASPPPGPTACSPVTRR